MFNRSRELKLTRRQFNERFNSRRHRCDRCPDPDPRGVPPMIVVLIAIAFVAFMLWKYPE